jgi:hypothetical protein
MGVSLVSGCRYEGIKMPTCAHMARIRSRLAWRSQDRAPATRTIHICPGVGILHRYHVLGVGSKDTNRISEQILAMPDSARDYGTLALGLSYSGTYGIWFKSTAHKYFAARAP